MVRLEFTVRVTVWLGQGRSVDYTYMICSTCPHFKECVGLSEQKYHVSFWYCLITSNILLKDPFTGNGTLNIFLYNYQSHKTDKFVSKYKQLTIYNVIIQSEMHYSLTVWGPVIHIYAKLTQNICSRSLYVKTIMTTAFHLEH